MVNLISNKHNRDNITVNVKDVIIGGDDLTFISGSCSVEDYDTTMDICKKLKFQGVNILRGGAFKPRTSPYDFQGLGIEGWKILNAVGSTYNMPIVSEVMDAIQIEEALKYVDMIQVGSRNMYNYTLLKELGKLQVPVLLKRSMSATLSEWLCAAEYILKEGNMNVVLCERGIRTFETITRNTLDLNAVAMIKEHYRLPVLVDPSHGTGRRELVKPMSIAGVVAGADGVILESHIQPDMAISDAKQTINVNEVGDIIIKCSNVKNILKGVK